MSSPFELMPRQYSPFWLRAVCLISGIVIGLVLATALLMFNGVDFKGIVREFVLYSFFSSRGLAQTISTGTPLLLVGLASAIVLKLRFWNIGIDGQAWLGAIAASGIAIYDVGDPSFRLLIMACAAIIAGAVWVGIPVFLKMRLGVNEVISTLMLTYVAFLCAQHFLYGDWRDPSTSWPVSVTFDEHSERLMKIGFGHIHDGVWIAVGAGLFVSYLMLGHRFGFFLSAIGLSPKGAKASGLPVPVIVILTVLIGGGLCGLAGFVIVAGQEYRLTQYVIHDLTFSAILIAFLARFNPIAVVPVSFLVAGLFTAGETLKAFYQLPLSLILVVQAIILGSVISVEFFSAYKVRINGYSLSGRKGDRELS